MQTTQKEGMKMTPFDYVRRGYEHAVNGLTRRKAKRWLSVSATVAQAKDYWRGYEQGAIVAKGRP